MAAAFRLVRRVEFADTDLAGIMHFSNFFRFMEVTEHAFMRSLGFSVRMEHEGREIGWPRVHAECSFRRPLRFEDEVEVLLHLRERRTRSLVYEFSFLKKLPDGSEEPAAEGRMVVACAALDRAGGGLKTIAIPAAVAAALDGAAGDG